MYYIFKSLILLTFLVVTSLMGCTKSNTPIQEKSSEGSVEVKKVSEEPFKYCADHSFCQSLRENEKKCRTSPNKEVCQSFVETLRKLAIVKDCKRKFDTSPVPSVWICDEDEGETSYPKLFERSASTLAKTKYEFAQKFYGSEAFRSVLDGAVADEHLEQSIKAGN